MFPKAYRFVDEMEEIASFMGRPAEQGMYEGIALLYQRLAADLAGPRQEIAALAEFFAKVRSPGHH
jgi:hypothetical protein